MEIFTMKGSRDTLLSSISQFLNQYLTTSLPDFSVLQYIYEEVLTFLFNKSINIDTIELYLESNFLNTRIRCELSREDYNTIKVETEKFLSQTGLNLLLNKFEIQADSSFILCYSLSYIDGNMVDKRHQLIQSYWRSSLKFKVHD